MIDYLIQNKDIFNISGIERRLNMPVDTIRKAISGDQKLPYRWNEPLRLFLNRYGYNGFVNSNSIYKSVSIRC